ncbi:MAG: pyroglutamyl-peptidase I [Pseudolabrys sp.]
MTTILVTGFGPFPGAPFNPTGPLVEGLARLRRPALADVTIVPYVFETSYAAVDRELPRLLTRHKPDALLMFGLAPRANTLRIETRARNAVALLSDVSGKTLLRNSIVRGGPPALTIPAQARRLFAIVRTMRIPVLLSRDAGRYLCNYLCWRASEAAARKELRLAAFVHVPPIARTVRHPGKRKALTLDNLSSAASQLLLAVAAAARR